jgi:hypothetical protein
MQRTWSRRSHVQASVFDAVNGIDHRYTPIHVTSSAPGGASRRAAAIQAAYAVLIKFYGAGWRVRASRRKFSKRSSMRDAASRSTEWRQTRARRRLTSASHGDKRSPTKSTCGAAPTDGTPRRRPLPAASVSASGARRLNLRPRAPPTPGVGFPQISNQTPWTMLSPSQFRPPAPYAPTVAAALASTRYAADFNETKTMGSFASPNRSNDQTIYALVWAAGTAAYLWNNAAVSLIDRRNRDDDEKEHKKDKHHSSLLEERAAPRGSRPRDGRRRDWMLGREIHLRFLASDYGDSRNCGRWKSIDHTGSDLGAHVCHSCASRVPLGSLMCERRRAVILANEFGDHAKFSISSDLVPGVSREFHGVAEALEEVKNARVFAGIHFRLACEVGQALGKTVAEYMLANRFQRVN